MAAHGMAKSQRPPVALLYCKRCRCDEDALARLHRAAVPKGMIKTASTMSAMPPHKRFLALPGACFHSPLHRPHITPTPIEPETRIGQPMVAPPLPRRATPMP